MEVRTKHSITPISFFACLISTIALVLSNYVASYQTKLGLSLFLVSFHLLTLAIGVLLLILGFVKSLRIKNTILYNFIGTFDSYFGILGILLFIFHAVTE